MSSWRKSHPTITKKERIEDMRRKLVLWNSPVWEVEAYFYPPGKWGNCWSFYHNRREIGLPPINMNDPSISVTYISDEELRRQIQRELQDT